MTVQPNQLADKPNNVDAQGSPPTVGAAQGTAYPKDVGGAVHEWFVNLEGVEVQITEGGVVKGSGGEVNTGENLGGEKELFKVKSGLNLQFRTLKAGAGISMVQNTDDIEISSSGEANGGLNVGTGAGNVFKDKDGVVLRFRRILAGTNVTITQVSDDIRIDASGGGSGEVNTGSSLGAGEGAVFKQKTGVDLEFRSIKAGTNVTITQDGSEITINSSGGVGGTPLEIKEAGVSVDTDVSELDFRGEGHNVTQTGAGQVQYHSREYKFTLPAAASLAARITASTDIPAGFTVQTADAAAEANFGSSVDTLVATHGLTNKIAANITVFEVTNSGPAGVQRITELVQIHTNQGVVRTNVAKDKCAVMDLTSNYALDPAKDLIVYLKLI
jgi:hypothetical protein